MNDLQLASMPSPDFAGWNTIQENVMQCDVISNNTIQRKLKIKIACNPISKKQAPPRSHSSSGLCCRMHLRSHSMKPCDESAGA